MTVTIISLVVAVVATVSSVAFSFYTANKKAAANERADSRQEGVILTNISYLQRSVDSLIAEVKADREGQNKFNMDVHSRLSLVESSLKRLHERLDTSVGYGGHIAEGRK